LCWHPNIPHISVLLCFHTITSMNIGILLNNKIKLCLNNSNRTKLGFRCFRFTPARLCSVHFKYFHSIFHRSTNSGNVSTENFEYDSGYSDSYFTCSHSLPTVRIRPYVVLKSTKSVYCSLKVTTSLHAQILPLDACRLRRGSAAARFLGLRVRILLGTGMFVSCECCVLSGTSYATGRSPNQTSPTECVRVSLSVIKSNNNPLHLQ
jgi:hypothetical protein